MATVDTETLLVKLEARITDFEKKMQQAERRATTASNRISGTFAQLNNKISGAMKLIGISIGAVALEQFVSRTIKAGSEISDLSQKLGITAEEFQKLSFAVTQTGAQQEDFVAGFRGMVTFLRGAAEGSKSNVATLKALGLTFDDLKRKSPSAVFEILLDRIGKIQNPLQRAAVLQTALGKSGTTLGALSLIGAAGIEELKKQAVDVGAVMDNQTVKALDTAGDKFDSLGKSIGVTAAALIDPFLPALQNMASAVQDPGFQAGLKNLADRLSQIIGYLTDHPEVLGLLAGAAAGGKVAGPTGALVGGALGGLVGLANTPTSPSSADRAASALGATSDVFGLLGRRSGGAPAVTPGVTAPQAAAVTTNSGKVVAANNSVADSLDELLAKFPDLSDAFDNLGTTEEDAADKAIKVRESLEFDAAQLQRTAREQAAYNAVAQAGVDIHSTLGQLIADEARSNYDLALSLQATIDKFDTVREVGKDVLQGIVSDLREGASAGEILANVFDKLASKLADIGIDRLLSALTGSPGTAGGGLFGGFLSALFGGARATGGQVTRGKFYKVGEHGTEFFTPNVNGMISPNTASGGGLQRVMIDLVTTPEIDARIRRVSGPQSQQISIGVVRANQKINARQSELAR